MALVFNDNKWSIERRDGQILHLNYYCKTRSKPFYVYDLSAFSDRCLKFQEAMPKGSHIHFAMKSNDHPEVLRRVEQLGWGVDVVSAGELRKALDVGIQGSSCVFSGVGKSREEIQFALSNQIAQINIESPSELRRVTEVAKELRLKAPIAFRMNPDVNPVTHPYIKTGFRENKFGMDESFLPELLSWVKAHDQQLNLCGLTLHIGSQIQDIEPFKEAIEKSWGWFSEMRSQGFQVSTFDVGGGLGIDYKDGDESKDFQRLALYGDMLKSVFKEKDCQVHLEPGRFLVARCGVLLTQVEYIKETPYKNFAIVNTGMHHLLRPALYEAYHRIEPIESEPNSAKKLYDVVGPICESADVIGHDRLMPMLNEGDWLVIFDAGAYGAVMASHYNSHELPEEIIL